MEFNGNRNEKGQFVKGWEGGPGRPEGFSLISILKAELQKCPEGQDKKTFAELIIKRMLKESIEKGDVQQIKLIWAYIEGMPKENIDLHTDLKILFDGIFKTSSKTETGDSESSQI